jgi:hypothetical protein
MKNPDLITSHYSAHDMGHHNTVGHQYMADIRELREPAD